MNFILASQMCLKGHMSLFNTHSADKAKEVIGMAKRISGPFEDEQKQVEWQKEVLREEYERKEDKRIIRVWR